METVKEWAGATMTKEKIKPKNIFFMRRLYHGRPLGGYAEKKTFKVIRFWDERIDGVIGGLFQELQYF